MSSDVKSMSLCDEARKAAEEAQELCARAIGLAGQFKHRVWELEAIEERLRDENARLRKALKRVPCQTEPVVWTDATDVAMLLWNKRWIDREQKGVKGTLRDAIIALCNDADEADAN